MNRPLPPRTPADRPVDERDWIAQERALSHPTGDRRDALLAQALRSLPVSHPPPDFAASVARAARAGVAVRADDGRLERMLTHGLLALLALVAVGATALWGGDWWAWTGRAIGPHAAQWAWLGATCLLLSWLPGAARRLIEATREEATA